MSIQIMIINILFTQKYYMDGTSKQLSFNAAAAAIPDPKQPPFKFSLLYNAKFLNYLRSKAS